MGTAGLSTGTAGASQAGEGGSSGASSNPGQDAAAETVDGGNWLGPFAGYVEVGHQFFISEDYASAAFYPAEEFPLSVCTGRTVGGCTLYDCPSSIEPLAAPQAGLLNVFAVLPPDTDPLVTGTLVATESGVYQSIQLTGNLYGEEDVTVAASGGDVPQFEGTIQFPLALLFTGTLPTATNERVDLAVSRTSDTPLAWERGADGVDFVVLGSGIGQQLICEFPSIDGMATIPAELVFDFTGDVLWFVAVRSVQVPVGEHSVDLRTLVGVLVPTKDAAVVGVVPSP
jgi:hypothetical protein